MGKKERTRYVYRNDYRPQDPDKLEWERVFMDQKKGVVYEYRKPDLMPYEIEDFFSGYKETQEEMVVPGGKGGVSVLRNQIKMVNHAVSLIKDGKAEEVTEEDGKRLLGLKLGFDRTYLGEESRELKNSWRAVIKELNSDKWETRKKYIRYLIDFQISQIQKLGAEHTKKIGNLRRGFGESETWNITLYSETGYIALAEEMIQLIEPGIDPTEYMKKRIDERSQRDADKKQILQGLRLLSQNEEDRIMRGPSDENIRKILWDLKEPIQNGKYTVVLSPGAFYTGEQLDGLCRKKSLIIYQNYQVREIYQTVFDLQGVSHEKVLLDLKDRSEHCYSADILSPEVCKNTFQKILAANQRTFAKRKKDFKWIADAMEWDLMVSEHKKFLDELVGDQIRLNQGLMSAKQEQEFYGKRDIFFKNNPCILPLLSYLAEQRTDAFARMGMLYQENHEKGENFRQTEIMNHPDRMRAQALEDLFRRAQKAAPALAKQEKEKAETNGEKRALAERGKTWMEELKQEEKSHLIQSETDIIERAQKRAEGLKKALGEAGEWGIEGIGAYKKLYYQENLRAIADVTKQLSQSKKKKDAPNSEYFSSMLEALSAFEEEKENGREAAIRACEAYINKRKGIFFGPATDAGKERLALAKAALRFLKEPEETKILSGEEVHAWDENRSGERKAREEYQERIRRRERMAEEEIRTNRQKRWKSEFEKIGNKENITKRRRYDKKWGLLPEAKEIPDDASENIKLSKSVDEVMQEKYKELLDLKRSGLLEPSEEILFDALAEMKQRNGFQLCSSAYETEEADRRRKERGYGEDKLQENLYKYASAMKKGMKKLCDVEEKDGRSTASERCINFLMASVKNLEVLYSSRPKERDNPYKDVRMYWNRREAVNDLLSAVDFVKRAENLALPCKNEKMLSPSEKKQKTCYSNMKKALAMIANGAHTGDIVDERDGMLDLRQEFDNMVHMTSETDEKQREALQNVMNAVGIVMQVYPNMKVIMDLDQIKQENLKGALYFQDAMRKVEGKKEEERKLVSWAELNKQGKEKKPKQVLPDKKEAGKTLQKAGKEKSGLKK